MIMNIFPVTLSTICTVVRRMNVTQFCRQLRMPAWPATCTVQCANFSSLPPVQKGPKMLAWQVEKYGGPDSLKLAEKPVPFISKPDQILIKVHAASVNPLDIRMRGGYGAKLFNRARGVTADGDELPLILGRDCSGVIVDVGLKVKGFEVGQEVWATPKQINYGTHAQYVIVTKDELSLKPKNLNHVEAASIPYVAITAWSATYAVAKIRPENAPDQRVLVLGGSGGMGSFAIQLLKAWGAHVTTTCSPAAMEFVSTLKPHCIIDYTKPSVKADLKAAGPFDFIFDTVGGHTEDYALDALKDRTSQYVTLVSPILREIDRQGAVWGSLSASWELFTKTRKCIGRYRWSFASPSSYALKEVAKLVEEDLIRPVVEKEFPFSEMPAAWANIESRSARGKTVINVIGQEKEIPTSSDFYMS